MQRAAEEKVVFVDGLSTPILSVFCESFQSNGRQKERKKEKLNGMPPPAVSANLMFMGFENAKGYIQYMYLFFLQLLNF